MGDERGGSTSIIMNSGDGINQNNNNNYGAGSTLRDERFYEYDENEDE